MKTQLENLRAALLKLDPSGTDGFEGLMGEALSEMTGLPFRLAASGTQYGKDGMSTTSQNNVVAFEAKRYDSKISKNEILSKLTELALAPTETDIWILGATVQVMSQHGEKIKAIEEKDGISALVLDWGSETLPPLAVVLAGGYPRTAKFIEANASDASLTKLAVNALQKITKHPDFLAQKDRLLSEISSPSRALAFAQAANEAWWTETFSSRKTAIGNVGQALCIRERAKQGAYPREALVKKLTPVFQRPVTDEVVCVLGNEGHGKSWLVAQTWESLSEKPLFIFIPADALASSGNGDIERVVLQAIAEQTDAASNPLMQRRWLRFIERWKGAPTPGVPRLVLVLDGVNQRPAANWRQIIGKLNSWVIAIGGRLIVTSRPAYFEQEILPGLAEETTIVSVPEWTNDEIHKILQANGVESVELTSSVAASLRNPRVLGIAIELLVTGSLSSTQELSVHRLLFEHIRTAGNDDTYAPNGSAFAETLKAHANTLRTRLHEGDRDDLSVVNKSIDATIEGRFFKPLDDDASKYEIRGDGLNIALALALIDEIRKAIRNNRDPVVELERFLDPISALDQTADVVLAALTIAIIECPDQHGLAAALICGFLGMQNPDEDEFSSFSALARQSPAPFLSSVRNVMLSQSSHRPNIDWLQGALLNASEFTDAWTEIALALQDWLRLVNVKTDLVRHAFTSNPSDDPQQAQKEFEKKMDLRMQALSEPEKKFFDQLEIVDADPGALFSLAFKLMVRKPLVGFSDGLVANAFSRNLNSGVDRAADSFNHLVFLNGVDWGDTRDALLDASKALEGEQVSTVGKWALAAILRSTGDSGDAAQAKQLVDELTKDREKYPGSRSVEKYCSSDPCDPASTRPENLARTLKEFKKLDVSTLYTQFGSTQQDHFYSRVLPGLARFESAKAVSKQQQLIVDIVSRKDIPLRQGLVSMEPNLVLTTPSTAARFADRWRKDDCYSNSSEVTECERRFAAGQTLLCALPQLSVGQQLAAFKKPTYDGHALLACFHYLKGLDGEEFAENIVDAAHSEHSGLLTTLILWARYAEIELTPPACACLKEVMHHGSVHAQAQVLALAAEGRHRELLLEVIDKDFSQASSDRDEDWMSWQGSAALLIAVEMGLVDAEKAIDQLSPSLLGEAMVMLGSDHHEHICKRIDTCLKILTGTPEESALPVMQVQADEISLTDPPRVSLSDDELAADDFKGHFERFSETSDEFNKRQLKLHDSFQRFQKKLDPGLARIVLGGVRAAAWRIVVSGCPQLAESWAKIFLSLKKQQLAVFHNDAMKLAYALSSSNPGQSERLFKALSEVDAAVDHVYGASGYSLGDHLTWAAPDSLFIQEHRARRLDNAKTDREISLVVLSALINGHDDELERYVSQKVESEIPSKLARGLMVAGFSMPSKFNDEVLARFENAAGFVGVAAQAAIGAYERNRWAMHWHNEMCRIEAADEFWTRSVLLLKLVDGRVDLWHTKESCEGQLFQVFWPSLQQKVKRRIKKWNDKREKKLFGRDAPISLHFQL